jgi:recombinational DNA repair protein RecT
VSTALQPTAEKPKSLRAWVQTDDARREIADAVGDIMPADQFIAHMLVAFQDEKVRACSDKSKFRAMKECAALGLLPTLGQVVLIPYKSEVKAMPQWQGYKALMERHPDILEVIGELVHTGDAFVMQEGSLQHSYDPFLEARQFKTSKDVRGGYCKIVYRDGRPPKYHMVRRSTIEQAQACAQTQNIWKKWYYEMALKTVYRNAYARRAVPIDPLVNARLERAINLDDLNLGNDPARITSEASEEHIEQARAARTAEEPPYDPPTQSEQDAAEGSQVAPDADAADGVDASPEDPTSDQQEEANLNQHVDIATTVTQVQEHVEVGCAILSAEAADRLVNRGEKRIKEIKGTRGARSNK